MWAILTSKLGLAGIALALVLAVFGIQALRLQHAKADLKSAQASLTQCRGSLATVNAETTARAEQSRKALDGASRAQADVAPKSAHIASQAVVLASHVVRGGDRCARWEDAEAAVRESLK